MEILTPLKNHPGWGKGKRILTNKGLEVLILEDGEYVDGGCFGLWNYEVKWPNGSITIRIPEVGDKPI